MGKLRLIAEFGKRYPCMNFCLRSGRRGYPPPDSDILDPILAPKPKVIPHTQAKANETIERKRELFLMWAHALAAAYLQASFDYCWYTFFFQPFSLVERRNGGLTSNGPFLVAQWIDRNLEDLFSRNDLAVKWHKHHNQYTQTEHRKPQLQQGRIDAYARICSETDILATKFAENKAFQEVFSPTNGKYQIRKQLRRENGPLQPLFASADALLEKLGGIKGDVTSGI